MADDLPTPGGSKGTWGTELNELFDGSGDRQVPGIRWEDTQIDDTDSPHTTTGEQVILVDTSSGAVTVTLASDDLQGGKEIRIVDSGENASSNAITINTEGSANINPGTHNSITLTVDGTYVDLWTDGTNWFTDRAAEKESLTTDEVTTDEVTTSRFFIGGNAVPTVKSNQQIIISNSSPDLSDGGASETVDLFDSDSTVAFAVVQIIFSTSAEVMQSVVYHVNFEPDRSRIRAKTIISDTTDQHTTDIVFDNRTLQAEVAYDGGIGGASQAYISGTATGMTR